MKNPFRKRISVRENSSLTCSTSFLPPGVNVRYTAAISIRPAQISELFRQIESLLVFPVLRLPYITDLKGAGPDDTLLLMHGTLAQESGAIPCSWTIKTRFHDFPEKNQIRFSWKEESELLEGSNRSQLAAREDLQIDDFTLSLELFKNTIITRMTGFGPVVAESLTLTVTREACSISISADGLTDIDVLPLNDRNMIQILDGILCSLFNFSLLADYQSHQGELR